MILDEIHLLGADRGPILEVLASIYMSIFYSIKPILGLYSFYAVF